MSADHSPQDRGLSRRDILRRGAVATAVAGFGLSGLAGNATATKNRDVPADAVPIDGPTRITESGYYVLTTDIENASGAISVEQGLTDVTIDGRGHSIKGQGKIPYPTGDGYYYEGVGINIGSYEEAEVVNITIKDLCVSGFFNGLRFESVRGGTIQNVNILDCDYGTECLQTYDVTVKNCLFKKNNQGFYTTEGGGGLVFHKNRFIGNRTGALLNESDDALFKDNYFAYNTSYGVEPVIVDGYRFIDNTFYKNGNDEFGYGIFLDEVSETVIRGNRFIKNLQYGLYIGGGFGNHIEKNIFDKNGDAALRGGFQDSTISKNTITDNGGEGISLVGTSVDNEISKNVISGNSKDGILFVGVDGNQILKNTIRNNGGDGIELRDSDNNVIRKNTIIGNAGLPIRIDDDSTGNVIEKNTTSGVDDDSDGGHTENNHDGDVDICRVDSD